MREVLLEDSRDFYNRWLVYLLAPLATIWVVVSFGLNSSAHDGPVSISRDAGLRMTLVQPFPGYLLAIHSVCGALLIFSVMLQKFLVVRMSKGEKVAT